MMYKVDQSSAGGGKLLVTSDHDNMDLSEDPTPIRSKTWSFYIALFVAVAPLWSSVPLAWIFTAHSLIAGSFSILFYVALGEVSGHP